MPEEREDNTTGEQASQNKIKQAAKPSDNRMMQGVRKRVEKKEGLDLGNVPKKLRIEGQPQNPVLEGAEQIDQKDIDKAVKGDKKVPFQ